MLKPSIFNSLTNCPKLKKQIQMRLQQIQILVLKYTKKFNHQLNLEIEQQAMRLLGLCFHLLPLIKIFISQLNPYSSF